MIILKSFFVHNHIPVEPDIRDRYYVKYHNRPMTKSEIKRILEHSELRDRLFFLMMLESGQRPNTLVQLQYKHVKDDFERKVVPMKIDLPVHLLKDRVGHRFCFIGQDASETLRGYLIPRLPLSDDDLIFVSDRKDISKGKQLTTSAFSTKFNRAVRELNLSKSAENGRPAPIRLYCLRKYFRNNLKVSDPAYRKFWMGRSFGTDEHYLTRDVEKHRKEYAKAYPSIRIYQPTTAIDREKLKEELTQEIETTLRKEYETKLQEQIKTLVQKEIRKHIVPPEIEEEYRLRAKEFIFNELGVKPEKVDYCVSIEENSGRKVINVLGYWKDGKYHPVLQPAKIYFNT